MPTGTPPCKIVNQIVLELYPKLSTHTGKYINIEALNYKLSILAMHQSSIDT